MAEILTIDLGTSYFKFALFDRGGRLCDVVRLPVPIDAGNPDAPAKEIAAPPSLALRASMPQPGFAELPAGRFADLVARGIEKLRNRDDRRLADVEAIAFATQTNSFLLLDGGDRPLTPIVLWPDRRAADLDAEVARRCDVPGFRTVTGIPQINWQFMLAKLLWLRRHAADACRRMGRLCLVGDYLTFLLTGRHATEAGTAALTGLVDIARCQWWTEMLARCELDERNLPPLVRAGTDLGPITPSAAARFGLPPACRFVVGCLDQYAGAIGVGNVAPGTISETTGTVLATVRCADRLSADPGPGVFQGPSFSEGLYWQMVFGDVSANYLEWYRAQLPDAPEFEQLVATAATVEPGAGGLRLTTGAGWTAPAAVFDGLTAGHSPGHLVRCILEAVAEALAEQVAVLAGGPLPAEIRCAGGAARSELWLQIKADVLGTATVATQCPEPTALGAAVLAEAALSGGNVRQVAAEWVRLRPPHLPDPLQRRQYEALRRMRPAAAGETRC